MKAKTKLCVTCQYCWWSDYRGYICHAYKPIADGYCIEYKPVQKKEDEQLKEYERYQEEWN